MRRVRNLKNNFKFKKYPFGEIDESALLAEFDDSSWRSVSVPHDWGIEGEFSPDNDPSFTMIVQDGMTEAVKHTGRTGGLPTVGEGIYRTWVELDCVQSTFLQFDGVMKESRVYINGQLAGGCHFGYLSYEVDITKYVKKGLNLIAVHAIVPPDSSRWYSGAGFYRNVRLVTKPEKHIRYNGVCIKQVNCEKDSALIDISVDTVGCEGFTAELTSPDGKITAISSENNTLSYRIATPMLWDINEPNLYRLKITVASGDFETVRFGIRNTEFTKDGFFLNGRYLKLKGVCLHHDMGCIGTAVNVSALSRQLDIMQSMGVNAVRTSHNPPAPELLELCDERGLLVIDEFFDEWTVAKVENGYRKDFDAHALSDISNIIHRDRNHPSVIMWSIGNEIGEQGSPDGWKVARMLTDAVHGIDSTRPVTVGCDRYPDCIDNGIAFNVDILGLNYKPHTYKDIRNKYPGLMLFGSETASCISTRGAYELPAEVNIGEVKNDDLTVSDYGLCAPPWAYYAERELSAQQDCPFVMGEFVWTGFDYLGEPTPYYTEWPSRSSYFGAVDMAGLPKNRYYLYKSAWTDIPTLHIFPHWNWEGREGSTVPVHIYTNYDEVELFINGVSHGRKRKSKEGNDIERFRLIWNDTVYTPGEVCAVAYKNGKEVQRRVIRTAGAPQKIELSAYYKSIKADGESLNYITAVIVDKDGNVCPNASNRLTFSAVGGALVYATDAGDQRETETFLRCDKKALSGMLVCCVKSNGKKETAVVSCFGEGLISGEVSFDVL